MLRAVAKCLRADEAPVPGRVGGGHGVRIRRVPRVRRARSCRPDVAIRTTGAGPGAAPKGPVFSASRVHWERVEESGHVGRRRGARRMTPGTSQSRSWPSILRGVKFPNPILTASGTFHYGKEFAPYFDLRKLGGVIVKSLSAKPWPGHPPPRGAETPSRDAQRDRSAEPRRCRVLRSRAPVARRAKGSSCRVDRRSQRRRST